MAVGFTSGEVLEPSHRQAELEHEDGERLTSLKSVCVCGWYLNQRGGIAISEHILINKACRAHIRPPIPLFFHWRPMFCNNTECFCCHNTLLCLKSKRTAWEGGSSRRKGGGVRFRIICPRVGQLMFWWKMSTFTWKSS